MGLGDWLGPVATLGSAVIGAVGSKAAADAASDAAASSAAVQREMYYQNREDLAPYREAGQYGLNALRGLLTDGSALKTSPGYQFRLNEGLRGVDRNAAAKGMLDSGSRLKAIERYGQDYASGEYNNLWNKYASLAGVGQSATSTGVANGQSAASGIGSSYLAGGQARASGYTGMANAANGALNNLYYLYGR